MRTGDASGACARALRPRERGTIRLRRIRRRQHQRLRLVAVARTQLAQPLHRTAERKLRTPESLDEVAAPAGAERLERTQLAVHRAVAARDYLASDAVARHDPLPLQQQLRDPPAGRPS